MNLTENIKKFGEIVSSSEHILLVQPDKLDTDSIASALALGGIFKKLGKKVSFYSTTSVPTSLQYISGWENIDSVMPTDFDLTILVDGAPQKELVSVFKDLLGSKPFVHFDHHSARPSFPFSVLDVVDPKAAATGELIYKAVEQLGWPIDKEIGDLIGFSILLDTGNFTTSAMREDTFMVVSKLCALGVSMYDLFRRDVEANGYDLELLRYKAELIERIKLHEDGRIGFVSIPLSETVQYKDRIRPMDLIIYDIQRLKGVDIALVLSEESTGVKGSMRANTPIAAKIATQFGGGGHDMAAAFFVNGGNLKDVKNNALEAIKKLL